MQQQQIDYQLQETLRGTGRQAYDEWVARNGGIDAVRDSMAQNLHGAGGVLSGQLTPGMQNVENSILQALQREGKGTPNPEQVNALVQTFLGLQNIPTQQFYQGQIPGAFSSAQNLYNMAGGRLNQGNLPPLPTVPGAETGPTSTLQSSLTPENMLAMVGRNFQLGGNLPAPSARTGRYFDEIAPGVTMSDTPANVLSRNLALDPNLNMDRLPSEAFTPQASGLGSQANVANLINALNINPDALTQGATAPDTTSLTTAQNNMLLDAPGLSHQDRINRAVANLGGVTRPELDRGGPGVTVAGRGGARERAEGLGVGSELSAGRGPGGGTVEGELLQALMRGRGLDVSDRIRNLNIPAAPTATNVSQLTDYAAPTADDATATNVSQLTDYAAPTAETVTDTDVSRLTGAELPGEVGGTLGGIDTATLQASPDYQAARQALAGDINESFAEQERQLASVHAAQGTEGSTMALEDQRRLAGEKARAMAMADLQALQVVGGERRADLSTATGIEGQRFGQGMANEQLALQGLQGLSQALGTAAGIRGGEYGQGLAGQQLGLQGQDVLARGLGTAAQIRGQEYGQGLAGQQLGLQGQDVLARGLGTAAQIRGQEYGQGLAGQQLGLQGQDVLARSLGTAAGIRGGEYGQELGGAELGLRGAGLLGSEQRANLGAYGGAAQALQNAQLQNLGFGSQQALARGGENRANLGLLSNILGQEFGQNLGQRQFEQSQALARGGEARADLGAFGQEGSAGLGRALARGDFTTQQAQALSGLAGDEQARELQRLGFGSQQALNQFGLGAQQAGMAQGQANAVAQAEQFGAGQEMQAANLQLQQSLQEAGLQRGDIERSMDIINQRFGQNMSEGRFDLDAAKVEIQRDLQEAGLQQSNAQMVTDLASQSFGQAMTTAQFNASQGQQQYGNQLQNLLAGENIFGQRFGQAQQPLSMLLSTLAGNNVAPGVLGPMQMPRQTPGMGEIFGNVLGNIGANLPFLRGGG